MDKKEKTNKTPTRLIAYSFYYEGREYVVEAINANEARKLFNDLIKKQ